MRILPGASLRGGHSHGGKGVIVELADDSDVSSLEFHRVYVKVKDKGIGVYFFEEIESVNKPGESGDLPEPGSPVIHKIQRVKGE